MTWIYDSCIRLYKENPYHIDIAIFFNTNNDEFIINTSNLIDDVVSKWENQHPKYKDMDLISALELEFELNDIKAEIYTRA